MEVEIAKKLIPKKDLIGSFLTKKRAPIDLILIVIILLITGILLRAFHVSDKITNTFRDFNYNLVIELLIIFLIATIGLILFTKQRFKEYKEDIEEAPIWRRWPGSVASTRYASSSTIRS